MKKALKNIALVGTLAGLLAGCEASSRDIMGLERNSLQASHVAETGFDGFGYNYQARTFVGPLDGADRNLDGAYWGDPTYANDHLKMSWSKAWDDARFHGEAWTPDAWVDNQFNGQVPGGSGETWHYKIVWVGPQLEQSPNWREGGYAIWGQFEVVMDQGVSSIDYGCDPNNGGHQFCTHAVPTGYGN